MSPLRWLLALALCGFVALAAFVVLFRRDVRGPIGTTLVYDDLAFTVKAARVAASLPGAAVAPKGVYELVEVEVTNRARRVDYDLARFRLVLFDEYARCHDVDPAGQAAWRASAPTPPTRLSPGDSWTTTAVFDVPPGAKLEFGVLWNGPFLEAVDYVLFGERRVELR